MGQGLDGAFGDGRIWSTTHSGTAFHAFRINETGRPVALCRKNVSPRSHTTSHDAYVTAEKAQDLHDGALCGRCAVKLAEADAESSMVYRRTENGETTYLSRAQGEAEISRLREAYGRNEIPELFAGPTGATYTDRKGLRIHLLLTNAPQPPTPAAGPTPPATPPADGEPLPQAVADAAPGEFVVLADEHNPAQIIVWRDRQHAGVIGDETAANLTRGAFTAWSPTAQRRDGNLGFFPTKEAAADAVKAAAQGGAADRADAECDAWIAAIDRSLSIGVGASRAPEQRVIAELRHGVWPDPYDDDKREDWLTLTAPLVDSDPFERITAAHNREASHAGNAMLCANGWRALGDWEYSPLSNTYRAPAEKIENPAQREDIQPGTLVRAVIAGTRPAVTQVRVDRQPWGDDRNTILSDGRGIVSVYTASLEVIERPAERPQPTPGLVCVHGTHTAPGAAGDPIAACQQSGGRDTFGVFNAEGCTYADDCAVDVANEAAKQHQDDDTTWGRLCDTHPEETAHTCPECFAD
ncbi:hypothetical protein OG897_40585 [Streptomyces sp. NBC_00237]|uniref:hypothetical protein n=1 Tax=Streptomyces sp. NBC_00237 TaxID=2975687 RepID=UPI00225187B2|nr:hypothetical protein [Streptomyces sp. NBC_00237]MCX5207682.1 hypothetical protein [Streptomyces sp. NBC_00237]